VHFVGLYYTFKSGVLNCYRPGDRMSIGISFVTHSSCLSSYFILITLLLSEN